MSKLDRAFASPLMQAALSEVRQLMTSLSDNGGVALMKQILDILNLVNEQLYGIVSGAEKSTD